MALSGHYGGVRAGVARGLSLRMDHGTQYLSEHFQNQFKFGGIEQGFAFGEQPQTYGVAERFNRTLKEQVIHGRVFQTLEMAAIPGIESPCVTPSRGPTSTAGMWWGFVRGDVLRGHNAPGSPRVTMVPDAN